MMLGVRELEKIQAAFPDLRMELVGGKVVVMSPSDLLSSAVAVQFAAHLAPYVRERKLGTVAGAEGGYILPNGDLRAPDVSFISFERLRSVPHEYARAVPEFAVEVLSSTDRRRETIDKLNAYLEAGAVVCVYVDPREREVRIMRRERPDEVLDDGGVIAVPELFPGWEIAVKELWPPDAP